MRMRSRAGQAVLASIVVVVAGCGGATTHTTAKRDQAAGERDRAGGHEAKVEVRDPDQGGKPGTQPQPGGLPGPRAPARVHHGRERPQRARAPSSTCPQQLGVSDFQPGTTTQEARDRGRIRNRGSSSGPTVGVRPGADHREPARLDHLRPRHRAGDRPQLRRAGQGCRVWVAAAGGGIWRTSDALAAKPPGRGRRRPADQRVRLARASTPTTPPATRCTPGTGEANAINQAGLGPLQAHRRRRPLVARARLLRRRQGSLDRRHRDRPQRTRRRSGSAPPAAARASPRSTAARRVPPGAPTLGVYVSHRRRRSTSACSSACPASPAARSLRRRDRPRSSTPPTTRRSTPRCFGYGDLAQLRSSTAATPAGSRSSRPRSRARPPARLRAHRVSR